MYRNAVAKLGAQTKSIRCMKAGENIEFDIDVLMLNYQQQQ